MAGKITDDLKTAVDSKQGDQNVYPQSIFGEKNPMEQAESEDAKSVKHDDEAIQRNSDSQDSALVEASQQEVANLLRVAEEERLKQEIKDQETQQKISDLEYQSKDLTLKLATVNKDLTEKI